jgi:hypothetical protein
MTPGDPVLVAVGWLCLALGGALLPGYDHRRLAGAGLLVLGLGLAAWRAGSAADGLMLPERATGFLVVNGGLLLLGAILPALAAITAAPGAERTAARALTAAGLGMLAWRGGAFMEAAGPLRALAAAAGLGLAGATLGAAGRALGSRVPVGGIARRLFPPPSPPPRTSPLLWAVIAAALAALLGPHTGIVFAGVITGGWAAYFALHPQAGRPAPVAPALTFILLPALWLLATVAGPVGLGVRALPQVPLSPAAELLLAPLLLLAAWGVAGLWPLQRQLPGALLAPLGAVLLLRIALPTVPLGLDYWRPVAVPVLLLGLWHAASHARWALLAAGAGVLGAAGSTTAGASGAAWLLAVGPAVELARMRSPPPRAWTVLRAVTWPLSAWGGLLVLEGGLRSEVVYTAIGALVLALLVLPGRAWVGADPSHAR